MASFASDNTAPVHPRVLAALAAANDGHAPAYGNDAMTARLRDTVAEVFDAPDNNLSCPIREQSTTAPQSLTLLNSDEVIRAAKLTAENLKGEPISAAYELILNRQPTAKEMEIGREFLAQSPMHEFCRALFNLNDFVYVN